MKIFMAIILCALFTGSAMAADVFTLPASKGQVTFPHKKHQEMLKDCIKCHEKGPGKIAELGKTWAHKVCVGCHKSTNKGPVRCADCHMEHN